MIGSPHILLLQNTENATLLGSKLSRPFTRPFEEFVAEWFLSGAQNYIHEDPVQPILVICVYVPYTQFTVGHILYICFTCSKCVHVCHTLNKFNVIRLSAKSQRHMENFIYIIIFLNGFQR